MAKTTHPDVHDSGLLTVKNNGNKRVLLSAQATTYTEANATFKLGEVAMVAGDFTIANGSVSGRKITVAAKTGIPISTTGTVTHEAIIDTVNSKVLIQTTTNSQAVGSGGTADAAAYDYESRDAT